MFLILLFLRFRSLSLLRVMSHQEWKPYYYFCEGWVPWYVIRIFPWNLICFHRWMNILAFWFYLIKLSQFLSQVFNGICLRLFRDIGPHIRYIYIGLWGLVLDFWSERHCACLALKIFWGRTLFLQITLFWVGNG